MLIYQRQYPRHYVLAQTREYNRTSLYGEKLRGHQILVEIAIPNSVSVTLDVHSFKSLDGGELCGSSW